MNPHPSIRSTLARLEVRPRRGMGQNFLDDDGLARWLAEALEAGTGDMIVEIGPGTGAVTQYLAGRGRRLVLVEMDRRLAAHHREVFAGHPGVEVIEADAMNLDLRPFFKEAPMKVFGNLPYSVGTGILMRWLANPSPVSRAVFMLQKEVCDRVTAAPRTKDYGQLSVRLQARWEAKVLRLVPPESFHPRPAVTSGVVAVEPRDRRTLPAFDEELLRRLLRHGFSQRRKQLKKLLPAPPMPWPDLCIALTMPATVRAEELSLAQWIDLARLYDGHPLKDHAQQMNEIFDVVDDDNCVIGREARGAVHQQGIKHRAVHVFVFNRHGELLLQKRSHLKDTCPEKWDSSCAGHLNAGESYATAAERELQEELGMTSSEKPPQLVAKIGACADTGWEFVELYIVRHDGLVAFPASEIECVAAYPLAEVRAWAAARPQDFAPGFLKCLEAFSAASNGL